LLPVVVVAAAAAISNIAQISFLQTLAAKKQKNPPRKRGKKTKSMLLMCTLQLHYRDNDAEERQRR
jgi:hypothetical protein